MPDTLRLVTIDETQTPIVQSTLEDYDNGIGKVRDSFRVGGYARQSQLVKVPGRYGGSMTTADDADNGVAGARWLVKGTTIDLALQRLEDFLRASDQPHGRGKAKLQWKPEGATRFTYYELRGTPTIAPAYVIQQARSGLLQCEVNWPVAPLAESLRMSWYDDWRDRGGLTGDAQMVEAGWKHTGAWTWATATQGDLRFPTTGVTGQQAVVYNDAREPVNDSEVTVRGRIIAGTGANVQIQAGLKYRPDDGQYVTAGLNAAGNLVISHFDGTTLQVRATSGTTIAHPTTYPHWVRIRAEGDNIIAEVFTSTTSGALAVAGGWVNLTTTPTLTVTWTGANANGMGVARKGYPVINQSIPTAANNKRIDAVVVRGPTYRGVLLPAEVSVPDIPGDAPAKVDIEVESVGGTAWLAAGWRKTKGAAPVGPFAYSWLYDETGNVSVTGAPTGGSYTLTINGVATSAIPIPMTQAGVLAAFESVVGAGNVAITLVSSSIISYLFLNAWAATPVTIALGTNSMTGGTTPGVTVSTPGREGVTPARANPLDATGSNLVALAGTTNAPTVFATGTSYGNAVRWASNGTGNVVNSQAEWAVDTSMFDDDPFARQTVLMVFGRLRYTTIAGNTDQWRITPSMNPPGFPTSMQMFSPEYGPSGMFLPASPSTLGWRNVLLGTYVIDRQSEAPINFRLQVNTLVPTTADFLDLDTLWFFNARQSFMLPTGKIKDANYPVLLSAGTVKRIIHSDLTSSAGSTAEVRHRRRGSAFSGELIEPEPGPTTFTFLTGSTNVPLDPAPVITDDLFNASHLVSFGITPRYRLAAAA